MRIFTSDTLGSRIARRLMPVTVAVPVALHFWTLMQTRLGLLDRDSAAVIDTMTTIAIFGAFVLLTSRMMNDLDTERRQREADLRDSEARFRAVTDTAGDAIVAAGPSGRIELWNKTAATIFGYASAEILGRSVSTIIPDRFQSAHEPAFEWAVATGESKLAGRPVELVGRRKDGSECPVELSLALWKAGEENHFTGIIRDISERKRAEAEREQLISDLKQAVTEIRTLEGFIPICAGCKKIRDDQGFWEHVENYVARNTEAKFSHGICPDCEKRLYPEE
jgi:PAS domain S-box-containing protein